MNYFFIEFLKILLELDIEKRLKAFEAKIEARIEEQHSELKQYIRQKCNKYSSVKQFIDNDFNFPIKSDEEMAKQETSLVHDPVFRKKMVKKLYFRNFFYILV